MENAEVGRRDPQRASLLQLREPVSEPTRASAAPNDPSPGSRTGIGLRLAVVFALLATVEAVVIARLVSTPQSILPPPPVPVLVESPQAGDVVMVDGREAGVTPLEVKVGANIHSIRVASGIVVQPPADIRPPQAEEGPTPAKADVSATRIPARQQPGSVSFSSPIELTVLEDGRVLGSSADGPLDMPAGAHELDLINTAFEYRSRMEVTVKAGESVSLTVRPPGGRLNINASPWAQVWIDGKPAGDTPLGNVAVSLGEHEILFRHPELGEHRETVVARPGVAARVSATFGR